MTVPKSADVSGGIPNRSLKGYGNMVYGDCTVAAYFHVEMFKNIAKGSSFKKVLWKLGFHCPTNKDAVNQYTAYLDTLGQKHSDTQGVAVDGWLNYQKGLGNVVAWSQVDTWSPGGEDRLHQAMIDYRGVILAGAITQDDLYNSGTLWDLATSKGTPNLGHAVALDHYTPDFDECVTWGKRQRMTPAFRAERFKGAFVFLLASEKDNPDFAQKLALIKTMTGASY